MYMYFYVYIYIDTSAGGSVLKKVTIILPPLKLSNRESDLARTTRMFQALWRHSELCIQLSGTHPQFHYS